MGRAILRKFTRCSPSRAAIIGEMYRWDTTELKSRNVFATKYYAAILLLAASWAFGIQWRSWRLLFDLPFAVAGFFHLSLAVVEVKDGALGYRRFLRWTALDRAEVVSCGLIWPPFIGYIKLNHFVPPWGRLYFVLDRNAASNPFRRGEYPLVRYINGEAAPPKGHPPESRTTSS